MELKARMLACINEQMALDEEDSHDLFILGEFTNAQLEVIAIFINSFKEEEPCEKE